MFFHVFKLKSLIRAAAAVLIIFLIMGFLLKYTHYSAIQNDNSYISVPIIMYHSVLKDPSKTDKYTITPSRLEQDLIYIKQKGYNSIFVSDLINYVYNDTPLPKNPVILTFDDGFLNNMTYALPLLEKYGMKATISVIGSYTKNFSEHIDANVNYAHLTWDDISYLNNTGIIEIANHTFNMHSLINRKGSMKNWGESLSSYTALLTKDISLLQKYFYECSHISCKVFTYPFGLISQESLPIIKQMGFLASLSCEERVNHITKDPECLYLLGRFNRHGNLSTEAFMKKIKEP